MERRFVFEELPRNAEELRALPEFAMSDPFMTAALTVAVLCRYEEDPAAAVEMLNALKGPRPLSNYEIQFLRDRLAGKGYKPYSFFEGATPANNYSPARPYTLIVRDDPYSYQNQGYARLQLQSHGADNPRPITLRQKGEQWLLWEQMLLSDIRTPAKDDPWA
ncbi:MAG: hypothetical protein IKQ04_05795 [Oscillospiraceae bacterium]|nr:hypothetical protein [Oscillospiraceae bacterium]MBR7010275.1 hypothetical protein [Oscillospiraceae bacterium]